MYQGLVLHKKKCILVLNTEGAHLQTLILFPPTSYMMFQPCS